MLRQYPLPAQRQPRRSSAQLSGIHSPAGLQVKRTGLRRCCSGHTACAAVAARTATAARRRRTPGARRAGLWTKGGRGACPGQQERLAPQRQWRGYSA